VRGCWPIIGGVPPPAQVTQQSLVTPEKSAPTFSTESLDIQRRVFGPEHPWTLMSMSNLAAVLNEQKQPAEAMKLYQQTLDIQRRVAGPEHPDTLRTETNLVLALTSQHRYPEAEKLARETLAIQRRVLGPAHPDAAVSTYNLACVIVQSGRKDEALSLLREAVDHGLPPQTDLNMQDDSALNSLHGDPRFAALLAHAKEVAAAAQKPN
jgi:tetratricopeptide (TPR) repeat protein